MTGENVMEDAAWLYMTWYYRQCEVVLVPSKTFRDELADHGVDPARIKLMPRGVDTGRFHPAEPPLDKSSASFTLLYVGRVSKEKNLDVLAEAFKLLNRADVKLRIVGGGPYLEEMRASLKGYHAEFSGYLEADALVRAYQEADLFVFPSTTDTFGNVIMEAHACGLPTLVTEIGGPAENVRDGVNGSIVKGNDVHALKLGMEKLLDKALLSRMGAAALDSVKDVSFAKAFEECWKLYA
jgi:glycosyltransferase involved in cell wall biosynthesis